MLTPEEISEVVYGEFSPIASMEFEEAKAHIAKLITDYGIAQYKKGFKDACDDIPKRIEQIAKDNPLI